MSDRTATAWTVDIPNFCPVSDNRLVGQHWTKVSRLKKADKEVVAHYIREAGVPQANGRRRLSATFWRPTGRGDCSNLLKSLLDALKAAGSIVDDADRWLEIGTMKMLKGPRRTVLTLEDMP